MWIFGKNGHLSIGQNPVDTDLLVVHAQLREELAPFVALLDEFSKERHEIQETVEGDYKFCVVARRADVAVAVARMVTAIDYGRLHNAVHIDFGAQPGYLLWLNRTSLQIATVRERGAT